MWTASACGETFVILHEETKTYYGGITRRGVICTGLEHAVRYATRWLAEDRARVLNARTR